MPLRFDHAVILVNDLDAAINDYRALGFNAFFGGEHAGGKTHNALIVFQDGGYVELLAPTDPALLKSVDPNDRSNFLFMFQYGEGFGGYALLSENLEMDIQAMRARGLDVELRPPGGRARPDGQELRWRSAMSGGSMTPFFIQDETPRVLRVPNDASLTNQPNGVSGVAGLEVAVGHLDTAIKQYQAMLDINPHAQSADRAEFHLNDFTITLSRAEVTANQLISLKLRAGENKTLDLGHSHRARLELVTA